MDLLTLIPNEIRKYIYASYALVGIVLGAVFAGFGALGITAPDWLMVAQAVYGYIGTATNLVALGNVNSSETGESEVEYVE